MISKVHASLKGLFGLFMPLVVGISAPVDVEAAVESRRVAPALEHVGQELRGWALPGPPVLAPGEDAGDGGLESESGGADGPDASADEAPDVSVLRVVPSGLDPSVGSRIHLRRCGHASHRLDLPPPHLS